MSTSVLLEESSSSSSSRERWWKRRRRGCLCMVLRGSSGVDDDQVEETRGQAMFAVLMIATNMHVVLRNHARLRHVRRPPRRRQARRSHPGQFLQDRHRTRVSNEMGAENVEKAKVAVAVTLKLLSILPSSCCCNFIAGCWSQFVGRLLLQQQSDYRKRVRVHSTRHRESYQEFLEAVGGST